MLMFTSTLVLQTTSCSAGSTEWGGARFSLFCDASFRETGSGNVNLMDSMQVAVLPETEVITGAGVSGKYGEYLEGCWVSETKEETHDLGVIFFLSSSGDYHCWFQAIFRLHFSTKRISVYFSLIK